MALRARSGPCVVRPDEMNELNEVHIVAMAYATKNYEFLHEIIPSLYVCDPLGGHSRGLFFRCATKEMRTKFCSTFGGS